jgi:hypothetical protein
LRISRSRIPGTIAGHDVIDRDDVNRASQDTSVMQLVELILILEDDVIGDRFGPMTPIVRKQFQTCPATLLTSGQVPEAATCCDRAWVECRLHHIYRGIDLSHTQKCACKVPSAPTCFWSLQNSLLAVVSLCYLTQINGISAGNA